VQEINNDIQNSSVNPVSKLKPINNVISLINNASEKNKRKPDTFKVFLKKLSDHQDTDPSLAELCKKSIALNNEKEKLKAINLCIEKINVQTNSSKTEKSTVNSKADIPETLRESIERCTFQYGDKHVPITISCGLAEFKGTDNLDKVFKKADKTLYKAKDSGRNCCISEDQLHLL